MAIWRISEQGKKLTGGKYKKLRCKRKRELGNLPTLTKIMERKMKREKGYGGKIKVKAISLNKANVFDPFSKQMKVVEIKKVVQNPANRHFARMNILTKGTIIETEAGKARITNRPSREGIVNAILIKEETK
ncbi:MAG: 30S ribosomal protein S8e [Candidatus Parvarchaeota archaeon]|nr:30S ribosomal protein S8e [Candidatus Jingweiarchaeum tengchongense]MCW1298295.1 30S ribosomal protein S8e [Candidatus Jingweiarchaeum tengchongense]MCW1300386.1 30S ribosomal protein S8e [Candidatus Jingweiarchaeum tengchongense]MCW1304769.1 30S ribosomal protein S8e [Candidatus Jingweiarchaeum tengchongense]MCW1305359.1 30S ribosomal protein S8e [Candidatus Jingweiarchaeum tengchongense]